LESALARPVNKYGYGETDLAALAAAYGFGVARNHPFVDGNKRTALASMIVFLNLNKLDLEAPQDAATAIVLAMAAGEIGEDVLARWIADHVKPLKAPGIQP
jgi:death-on-curing protein